MLAPEMQAALGRVDDAIVALLAAHDCDKQHVKAFESFLAALDQEPLLSWKEVVPPDRMGCHPKNRSGIGLVAPRCMSLGSANIANGYSYSMACRDAVASSTPPYDGKSNWHAWNEQLNKRQSLPPLMDPKGLSLGAGHGNGFCRLANAKHPCSIKAIAPTGFLDPAELSSKHPGLGQALIGLEWRMIHYALFDKYPQLADITQKALNSKNLQAVTEMEGCLAMAAAAAAMGTPIDWEAVSEQGTQSKPTWQPWVHQMIKVVKVTPLELIDEAANNAAALVPHLTRVN